MKSQKALSGTKNDTQETRPLINLSLTIIDNDNQKEERQTQTKITKSADRQTFESKQEETKHATEETNVEMYMRRKDSNGVDDNEAKYNIEDIRTHRSCYCCCIPCCIKKRLMSLPQYHAYLNIALTANEIEKDASDSTMMLLDVFYSNATVYGLTEDEWLLALDIRKNDEDEDFIRTIKEKVMQIRTNSDEKWIQENEDSFKNEIKVKLNQITNENEKTIVFAQIMSKMKKMTERKDEIWINDDDTDVFVLWKVKKFREIKISNDDDIHTKLLRDYSAEKMMRLSLKKIQTQIKNGDAIREMNAEEILVTMIKEVTREKNDDENRTILETKEEAEKVKATHFTQWNSEEVIQWILSQENGRWMIYEQQLRESIKKKEIDGKCLSDIKKCDLMNCGISKFIDTRDLFSNIVELVSEKKMHGINIKYPKYEYSDRVPRKLKEDIWALTYCVVQNRNVLPYSLCRILSCIYMVQVISLVLLIWSYSAELNQDVAVQYKKLKGQCSLLESESYENGTIWNETSLELSGLLSCSNMAVVEDDAITQSYEEYNNYNGLDSEHPILFGLLAVSSYLLLSIYILSSLSNPLAFLSIAHHHYKKSKCCSCSSISCLLRSMAYMNIILSFTAYCIGFVILLTYPAFFGIESPADIVLTPIGIVFILEIDNWAYEIVSMMYAEAAIDELWKWSFRRMNKRTKGCFLFCALMVILILVSLVSIYARSTLSPHQTLFTVGDMSMISSASFVLLVTYGIFIFFGICVCPSLEFVYD